MGYPAKDNSPEAERARMRNDLLHIAAVMVQCQYLPSDNLDDYHQKTYSAKRGAEMMEKAHDKSKDLAVQIRKIADKIK